MNQDRNHILSEVQDGVGEWLEISYSDFRQEDCMNFPSNVDNCRNFSGSPYQASDKISQPSEAVNLVAEAVPDHTTVPPYISRDWNFADDYEDLSKTGTEKTIPPSIPSDGLQAFEKVDCGIDPVNVRQTAPQVATENNYLANSTTFFSDSANLTSSSAPTAGIATASALCPITSPNAHKNLLKLRVKNSNFKASARARTCLNCHKNTDRDYCCDECGIQFFLKKIRKKNQVEALEHYKQRFEERKRDILKAILKDAEENKISDFAESDDLRYLEEVITENKSLDEKFEKLEQRKLEFQRLMNKCMSLNEVQDNPTNVQGKHRTRANNEVIDCVCCGHTLPLNGFATHVLLCYFKQESQLTLVSTHPTPDDCNMLIYCDFYNPKSQTYCKKLKASCFKHSDIARFKQRPSRSREVCGHPTEPGGICMLSKKTCQKHVNWENIRQSELKLEEISLNRMRSVLELERTNIQDRMVFRRLYKMQEPYRSIPEIEHLASGARAGLDKVARRFYDERANK